MVQKRASAEARSQITVVVTALLLLIIISIIIIIILTRIGRHQADDIHDRHDSADPRGPAWAARGSTVHEADPVRVTRSLMVGLSILNTS